MRQQDRPEIGARDLQQLGSAYGGCGDNGADRTRQDNHPWSHGPTPNPADRRFAFDRTSFNRRYRHLIEFFLYVRDTLSTDRARPGPTVTQPDRAIEYEVVRRTKGVDAKIALPFE